MSNSTKKHVDADCRVSYYMRGTLGIQLAKENCNETPKQQSHKDMILQ